MRTCTAPLSVSAAARIRRCFTDARGSRVIEATVPRNATAPITSIASRVPLRRACEVAPRKNSASANSTVCNT